MSTRFWLSVLFYVRNRGHDLETSLSTLLEHLPDQVELLLLDDASSDQSGQIIDSMLHYYDREQVQFFQNESFVGKGAGLNELIFNANAPWVWVPGFVDAVDWDSFRESCLHQKETAIFFGKNLAHLSPAGDTWARGSQFLWNWNKIPTRQRFFNPFLDRFLGHELFFRVHEQIQITSLPPNAVFSSGDYVFGEPTDFERSFFRSPKQNDDVDPRLGKSAWLDLIDEKHRKGHKNAAIELIDALIQLCPEDASLKEKRIGLLRSGRRYVEASEALTGLKNRTDSPSTPDPGSQSHSDIPSDENAQSNEIPVEENISTEHNHSSVSPDEGGVGDTTSNLDSNEICPRESGSSTHQEKGASEAARTTVIIPTTIDGQFLLEKCLVSLQEIESAPFKLVIIDNASLDDTFEYLNQLKADNAFDVKVITNPVNKGFAASVNQALEIADTEFALVLHNDTELTMPIMAQFENLLNQHAEVGLAGSLTNASLLKHQVVEDMDACRQDIEEVESLDSFCLFIRCDEARFDEQFAMAHFDDLDFCLQHRQRGKKLFLDKSIFVHHVGGITTNELGLRVAGRHYWRNSTRFYNKWEATATLPEHLKSASAVNQLIAIGQLISPYHPEKSLVENIDNLLNAEVKTEILNTSFQPDQTFALITAMITADNREVLRPLEDRIENESLPTELLEWLIDYYFRRNIFSRCEHYLQKWPSELPTHLQILGLSMLYLDRHIEEALVLSQQLLTQYPANPDLYKIVSDIYRFEHRNEEAEQFYQRATQLNPIAYPEDSFLIDEEGLG